MFFSKSIARVRSYLIFPLFAMSALVACTTHGALQENFSTLEIPKVLEKQYFLLPILPPQDWGKDLSEQQLLSIQVDERQINGENVKAQEHHLQSILEISEHSVKLVLLKFSQRLLTIEHTARGTHFTKDTRIPYFLDAQQILQDIELIYAPLKTLRNILPLSCSLMEEIGNLPTDKTIREVICHQKTVYQIIYQNNNSSHSNYLITIKNIPQAYTIQINATMMP